MVSSCVHLFLLLLCLLLATFMPFAASEVHYHNFIIQQTPVKRLCKTINSVTVNGQYPGPTLAVRNGDTLIINAVNRAQSNITLHWHGVRQLRTGWADGPEYVTQCPIQPGGRYTYRFTITGQEGTLWWHAHSTWLRATVHGALIIYPKLGTSYPFPKPQSETTIILGEWWNANPVDVINQATRTGSPPNASNAFTINGQPGDLYRCSSKDTTVIPVAAGETTLLRIVAATMNQEVYFAIANHQLTVVGIDGSYTKPFTTNIMMIAPGQTYDVLLIANQPPGRYYIAAHVYETAQNAPFDNTTTTAILEYKSSPCPSSSPSSKGVPASSKPPFPTLPFYNDTRPATAFAAGLRSLYGNVPQNVDYNLFITVGLGTFPCPPGQVCGGPNGTRLTASTNNVSLVLPSNNSILQAYVNGQPGVFTTDYPPVPPIQFDYTAANISTALWTPVNGTKVFKVKYGTTVQMVWQDTNIVTGESHPMHLHGYDFYILAEGFGNFNPQTDTARFNLVDPPLRNTAAVPVSGWSVVRFKADNPGAWLMHCHYDTHIVWGLSMVLLVENGVGELESLEPPPPDLPQC